MYRKWLDIPNWPIDGIVTRITTPDQNGSESDGNEKVLHTR